MAESPTPFAEIDLGPSKLDQFLDAHQKKLILTAILLAIGLFAYVIYTGIAKGEAEDAGAALVKAEKVADYKEVITQWPNSKSAGTALPLIAQLQGKDDPKEAIQTLKDFLDNNPDHPAVATAKVSLALRLMDQGNADEATSLLTEVTENENDDYIAPLACISLGDIAKAAGKKDEAKTWYEKAQEDTTDQGNTFKEMAVNRLALVNALPPKKIKPAPPAPLAPPVAPAKPKVLPVPPAPAKPQATPQAPTPAPEATPTPPTPAPPAAPAPAPKPAPKPAADAPKSEAPAEAQPEIPATL